MESSSAEYETKRRLRIAKEVTTYNCHLAYAVVLGGSMGYGQNYSVTSSSDIDMVLVTNRDLYTSFADGFFSSVSEDARALFRDDEIDFFWVSRRVRGVELNMFVYDKEAYTDFCLLESGLRGYIEKRRPKDHQVGFGFDGKPASFDRRVRPKGSGYIYERPTFANGRFYGSVPRQDFFYSGYLLYDANGFWKDLEQKVWSCTVQRLIDEHGPDPDLDRFNVLNAHHTYNVNSERLPKSVVDSITDRTIKELECLQSKRNH